MIPAVLRCAGAAIMRPNDVTGRYLASYDLEANDGHGEFTWTQNRNAALVFVSFAAAYRAWRGIPQSRPVADGGGPNRPLSRYSILFEQAPVHAARPS